MHSVMLVKNRTGQKIAVYAYRWLQYHTPVTGDSLNITSTISLDGGACSNVTDTNPTELDPTNAPGVYIFDLTQAETNGDMIVLYPSSSSTSVQVDPMIITTEVAVKNDTKNYHSIMSAIKSYDHTSLSLDSNSFYKDLVDAHNDIIDDVQAVGFQKNVAVNHFGFVMINSSDGKTPQTGETVTVQRSIDGGAFSDCTNTPATEIGSGAYYINLTASELNGDAILLKMTATNSLTRFVEVFTNDN